VQVRVRNGLPVETSVHWHGIRLHNAADGVPGITQDAIAAGADYTYTFVAPDPGTYFFHPHSGVQIDRGLYAPLIVDDPAEPGGYDQEWVLVLDDWTDGVGRNPDDILAGFKAEHGTVGTGMNHDMSGMGGMGRSPLGDVGDIAYPHYLVNGRVPAAPLTLRGRPGQRARIRIINAAADTLFRVALGGHSMTVTHTDGYPVQPVRTQALYLAQGERVDVLVTLGDGVFPLVAAAEGKQGQGLILVRT
jgi:FtsP/CotA-like multicopper oxidase with cupredoxin domain